MNIYNAIVVSNKGLRGEVEVYIPRLMVNMESNSKNSSLKNKKSSAVNSVTGSDKANGVPDTFSLSNTMEAKPFNMNTSKTEGSYLVPDEGSLVAVIFLNEDFTQCYYIYNASAELDSDIYVLDLEQLLVGSNAPSTNSTDSDKKANIKVLLRTKNNSVIAFDTNDDKNSFMVKINAGHFLEIQDNETFSGTNLTMKNGNRIEINDTEGTITITTKNDRSIFLSDEDERLEVKSLKSSMVMDDINSKYIMNFNDAQTITMEDGKISVLAPEIYLN